MRNNNPFSFWWILILFFVVIGSDSILPLVLLVGLVIFLMYKAVQASNNSDTSEKTTRRRSSTSTRRRTVNAYGMSDTQHSAADKAKVNAYLMKCYRDGNQSLSFSVSGHQIILTLKEGYRFTSIDSLQADCDGHYFQNAAQFRKAYGDLYNQLFNQLLAMAQNDMAVKPDVVVDAEVVGRNETGKASRQAEMTQKESQNTTAPKAPDDAESFRIVINDLNDAIPDEEISNALYETTNLLKQLGDLEKQFPEQKKKLTKLFLLIWKSSFRSRRKSLPSFTGIICRIL